MSPQFRNDAEADASGEREHHDDRHFQFVEAGRVCAPSISRFSASSSP
jgi:hypothetical protein